jgi:lysophospholipase L1-like esterase
MQAMNGSGRAGIRRFCRLAGCVAALAALSAMTLPSVAGARAPKIRMTYLSLGDSLAFGYSTQTFNEHLTEGDPATAFEHGYTNDYFEKVDAAKGGKVQLVNDGCPGETTESLIGDNATLLKEINEHLAGKINEPVTGEAPCAYQEAGLPLHHPYKGKSQLESALETLATEKAERKPVTGITLDIGSNDQLHFIAKLEAEVAARQARIVETKAKKAGEDAVDELVEAEAAREVGVFLYIKAGEECEADAPGHGEEFCASEYDASGHSYREVFEAQYDETHTKEITEKYQKYEKEYVPNNIGADTTYAEEQCEIDVGHNGHGPEFCESEIGGGHTYKEYYQGKYLEAYGKQKGEEFAAKYLSEHGAELAAEGKAIFKESLEEGAPALFEQIITNEIGILATIRGTGYKGKITFVGSYDTYGRIKFISVSHEELLVGSNALLAALQRSEEVTLHKHPIKACYADSQTLFNPASVENTVPNEELEEERLFAWTNMANTNVTEVPDSATLKEGSTEITAIGVPQFLAKGDKVSGAGIPAGTTVVSVNNGTKTAVLSKAAESSTTEEIKIGKKDGPDIHATKEGYEKMAEVINGCPF